MSYLHAMFILEAFENTFPRQLPIIFHVTVENYKCFYVHFVYRVFYSV